MPGFFGISKIRDRKRSDIGMKRRISQGKRINVKSKRTSSKKQVLSTNSFKERFKSMLGEELAKTIGDPKRWAIIIFIITGITSQIPGFLSETKLFLIKMIAMLISQPAP